MNRDLTIYLLHLAFWSSFGVTRAILSLLLLATVVEALL